MRPRTVRRRALVAGAAATFVGLSLPIHYAAAKSGTTYSAANVLATSGQVTGKIVCGGEDGSEPAQPTGEATVYLKGSAFTARTGNDGSFVIDYVPPRTYDLVVLTAGRKVRKTVSVMVEPHATTDVGTISVVGGCAGTCGANGETCTGAGRGGGCPVAALAATARSGVLNGTYGRAGERVPQEDIGT